MCESTGAANFTPRSSGAQHPPHVRVALEMKPATNTLKEIFQADIRLIVPIYLVQLRIRTEARDPVADDGIASMPDNQC